MKWQVFIFTGIQNHIFAGFKLHICGKNTQSVLRTHKSV